MNRNTVFSRPVRIGFSLAGAAMALVMTACGATTQTTDQSESTSVAPTTTSSAGSADTSSGSTESEAAEVGTDASVYNDGTYTASGSYQTPESVETIDVTITLEGDIITAVEVSGDSQVRESQQYQSRFIGGIADEVVGKSIDEVSVSRVAGSSLTSGGFNEALEVIKSEAVA